MITKLLHRLWIVLGSLWLASCTGGAVIFAPTPLPPDTSPLAYVAPGGVFTLTLPRHWAIFEPAARTLAAASFSPPGSLYPPLHVVVINTGQTIDSAELIDLVAQYQSQLRPDLARYTEQDRQLMNDGSWRLTGVRLSPGGEPLPVNTFLQSSGTLLAVIELVVPPEPALQQQLEAAINTFALAATTDLPTAPLAALASAEASGLEVVSVHAWRTAQDVFFITGEVAHHGTLALADVPVVARLEAADGRGIAEAAGVVMGHALLPGGFAPFGLRFGQGQPPDATQYVLSLGGSTWQPQSREVAPPGSLTWEDAIQFGSDGAIFVTGSITNTSSQAVRHPVAMATLFDADGRVIGVGFWEMPEVVLAPATSSAFSILIPEAGGVPANYVVTAQALPCGPEECS